MNRYDTSMSYHEWEKRGLYGNRYAWHQWFAWYPVRLTWPVWRRGHIRWLRHVWCREKGHVAPTGDLTSAWEYRI